MSVLIIYMYWSFSWKRGQHGSWWKLGCCWQRFPRWWKNEALSDFSMIVMISDTTTRTEICKLWWASQIILVINRTITSLEKELYLRMMDWLFIYHDIKIWSTLGKLYKTQIRDKSQKCEFFPCHFFNRQHWGYLWLWDTGVQQCLFSWWVRKLVEVI